VVGALVVGLGTSVWMFLRERELRHRAVAAEQEQVRLREIAERGLANEAELRRQSEAREAIVQATALIEQQAFAKADELIAKVPLMNPTFEGVEVFRTLGDWNAARRNWPAARDRFYRLWLASRVENASNTSLDITRAAVTYIECNDERGYEQFRQRVLETYAGTTEPLVAERVVKNCLLQPGGEPLLKALAPFAEVANQLLTGRDYVLPQSDGRVSWCCLSVALLQYRRGNWMESVTWSRRCLRLGEQPPPRAAAAQAILAMALFRSGEVAEAKTNLVKSRNTTETHLKSGLQPHAENAFWFDWIVAQILAREAETVVCP
jgi:hypothetical protein